MNWKPNYWTLLFALAVLGLAYQQYAGGQHKAKPEKEAAQAAFACPDSTHFIIPDSVASERIDRYYENYSPKVRRFAADSCNTLNGGVLNFGINKCELEAMLHSFTGADSLTAMMTLIPGSGGAKDTLDLIFQIYKELMPIQASQYYDFTHPCPPCAGN